MSAEMREHMRSWAQQLRDGDIQRDPVEDTADEVWQSLRIFAGQYLELLADCEGRSASPGDGAAVEHRGTHEPAGHPTQSRNSPARPSRLGR